jgi:hypothetical protein
MIIKINFLFFTILSLFLIGCKDENSVENLEVVTPQNVESVFKVSIVTTTKKDDDFCLFYTTDNTIDFKIEPIWTSIKGQETPQKTVFKLPENVTPTQLRIDFGLNKNQDDIVLKSILLEYKGKKREFTGLEIGNFFRPDDNKCVFDSRTGVLKAIEKDGNKQNPSLYPHESSLSSEINKLLN